ncbi:MAG: protoheme farnesyltransferase [Alphaproteobacteria bacterium]|jgi:protoheme IX farnesyltransferase|nr:protoheme farnesyltransferase [Alphaproteobacteria bacterium]
MTDFATYSFDVAPDAARAETRIRDFIELLKPRVMTLVVFSGVAGIVLAPGHLHPFLQLVAVFCIAVGAGASGAINMWYEQDIDAVMNRTKNRPIVTGRVDSAEALGFGVVLTFLSVGLMGVAVNWTAAALLAFASFFYVVIYTIWLKRITPQNIVIGGAAGAFPPMIGWAAVTGGVSLESIVMFTLIFLWTPPHFWALALYRNDDYKKANVPMMPVVAGEASTKRQMVLYTLLMTPFVLAPYFMGMAGVVYLVIASLLHLMFIVSSLRVLRETGYRFARLMFGYSIFYLFALFTVMMMDKV